MYEWYEIGGFLHSSHGMGALFFSIPLIFKSPPTHLRLVGVPSVAATRRQDYGTSIKSTNTELQRTYDNPIGAKIIQTLHRGQTVQLLSDNIWTVGYINHLGGPCPKLTELAKAIYAEAFALWISLRAKHLAGCLNTIADHLSRLSPQSTYSWSIHPAVFLHLDQIWGPHSIHRFADITNHVCPQYNSLNYDPLKAGVDALAQTDWAEHNNCPACSIAYSKL